MVAVVESCLSENIDTAIPAPIFTQIVSSRAEFAFVVVRKLHEALPDSPELFDGIFTQAWRAIGSSATEFHRALLTADMQYYRPLLRVIYIALVAVGSRPKQTVEMASQVQDLLTVVVAQGFKHLAQAAHALPEEANPQDIALITAILQASLRLKGVEGIYTHLGTHLAENGTIRAATTLFSWAEELAGPSSDPVYGELSVLFLLELSAIPTLADLLAQEGVLELLISSTLGQRIREGVSVTTDPRRHAIWCQGMLPIALNLLGTIGQRISREIIEFLRFYAPQINQAIDEMRPHKPKVVNLPMINEATTIVIIMIIIYRHGEPAALEGLNFDRQALVEGVDYLLTHKNYLKSLIVATSADEDEMERRETEGEGGNELADKTFSGLASLQSLLGDDEMEE
jgi:nuclear pore complex protein Nup188